MKKLPGRMLALIILLTIVLSACGGGATPTEALAPTEAPAAQPTAAPAEPTAAPAEPTEAPAEVPAEEVTLKVTDIWTRDEDSKVIDQLNLEFEEAHPGVTVERTVLVFEDLRTTINLLLSNPDGPDVTMVNQGYGGMGPLVEAGLLEDLTPYAEQYGWKVPEGMNAQHSWTPDGKQFGTGNVYGMGPTIWEAGVFYRKDMFEDLGLAVPATFAEFETALETIKASGQTPIILGNLDGLGGHHIYTALLYSHQNDRAYADGLIYGDPAAKWTDADGVWAAAKLQEWVEKGYFTEGFEGIEYGDQVSLFENGEGAMMLVGNWFGSTFAAGPIGDQLGFFLLPGNTAGGFKMVLGGTSLGYGIRAGSPNTELAAEYISWMASDRAAELWAGVEMLPTVGLADPSIVAEGTLMGDLVAALNEIVEKDEMGAFIDWSTPTAFEVHMAAIQDLMASRITPEEFGEALQQDRDAFLGG